MKDNVHLPVFLLSLCCMVCIAACSCSVETCHAVSCVHCKLGDLISLSALSQGKTLDLVQFSQNEAAFSVAVCTFASRSDTEWYVVVGTASHMTLSPRACSGGALVLFKLSPDGVKLEHVHTVSGEC